LRPMKTIENWLKIALFNLCLVALLGVTLRYKIAFSLPFIDQRNLLHGHSHFAFSGWVSQALMVLLVYYLHKQGFQDVVKRYRFVVYANLITAYGMLTSFPIQGYAFFSILFSTLSIFTSYIFAVMYWKDLNKLKEYKNEALWFKAAAVFNVISSAGPYTLAYVMATHSASHKLYLASVYFFLHFQYNGWFLFTCLGLFIYKISTFTNRPKELKIIFWIFTLSCIPSYLLSALWLSLSNSVYLIVLLSAIAQTIAWLWLIRIITANLHVLNMSLNRIEKWLFSLSAFCLTIKLLLQLASTHPKLSQVAFGFRPIVIGYIHLVLLGVITIFIIGYLFSQKLLTYKKMAVTGLIIFVSGIFINETLLMIQGVLAMLTIDFPYASISLFVAAIIMFTGIFTLVVSQSLKNKKSTLTSENALQDIYN
jgi:hypothetical protein